MGAKDKLQPLFDVLDANEVVVFGKRLSANDTGASGAHQAGVYVPNDIAFTLCPRLKQAGGNPDAEFETTVLSHDVTRRNRLTWYNQGSRNECRITRWADDRKRNSVLQRDMTGGLVIILFRLARNEIGHTWVWFCSTPEEEDLLEERFGVVEPGGFLFDGMVNRTTGRRPVVGATPCAKLLAEIPEQWLKSFPGGKAIVERTHALFPGNRVSADDRIVARRNCEYELFRMIEKAHVLPRIRDGFQTVDEFIDYANSVTNRRKSRSGTSFELQLARVFDENALPNTHGGCSEGKKKPDFLFPSAVHYHDPAWPNEKLRMLGVKTTCKDRWRQILNEADRVPDKHLVTLQEGLSVEQFREMEAARVSLVVPRGLHSKYPKEIRGQLLSLEDFMAATKVACG